jgi:catechol-2,3-dioxygenase
MKASIQHIHLNVSDAGRSIPFYEAFTKFLGYRMIDKGSDHIGFSNGTTDLWIVQAEEKDTDNSFHRKGAGLNHIAFRVSLRKDVVDFNRDFLRKRDIPTLYDSPKIFTEYHKGYFAVYFEDPDRVKLEVVYIPKFRDRSKLTKGKVLGPKSDHLPVASGVARFS